MTSQKKEGNKQSFEQSLRRLEEIVRQLEQGDVPLDESLKMYEEGIALSKACIEKLTQAELKVKKLGKDMEGNLRVFEEEEPE
jgi:exodeoxyribonuclease VII small subunit